jgi:hypothetical protein
MAFVLRCRSCDAPYIDKGTRPSDKGTRPSCECHITCEHCNENIYAHTIITDTAGTQHTLCPRSFYEPKARS